MVRMEQAVPMTKEQFRNYGIGRIIQSESGNLVTSIGFHRSGNYMAKAEEGGVIQLIDCDDGQLKGTLNSSVHGVDIIRMSHHPDVVLYSSWNDKNNHDIRLHSFFDNRYIRFFHAHTARVTSLSVHPHNDTFISSSEDGTIRLWDMNSPYAIGMLRCFNQLTGTPMTAYDPDGQVFAIYSDDGYIRLFDARNVADGPFTKFHLFRSEVISQISAGGYMEKHGKSVDELYVTKMQFCRDVNGEHDLLLILTNINASIVIDSFDGRLMYIHLAWKNEHRHGGSFSADGQFLAIGGENGAVKILNSLTGEHLSTLSGGHVGVVHELEWNPRRHMLVSSHINTNIWIPSTPID